MRTITASNRQASFKVVVALFSVFSAKGGLFRRGRRTRALIAGLVGFIVFFGVAGSPAFAATALNLGAAAPYAVVAGSTITNTGSSVITGDIGLSPGTSITGFPPGTVSGTTDIANANSLAAQTSATAAYGVAASDTPFTTVAGGTIGGMTLSPGVYNASSSMSLTGTVTLNGGGDPNAVFIFQAGSTLTTATSSSVVLENGAQACNVFWQVGSSATIGSTTSFIGTILALTSVTLASGASVEGSVFAQTGAVTLDDNLISVVTCATPAPPPVTTTTSTTTTTTTPSTSTTTTVPVVAVTTPTTPVGKVHPVTKGHGGSTTTTTPGSSTTVVPVGAPATGEGGTAGSGFSSLGLLGLGAIVVSASATSIALRLRRRRH